MPSIPTLPAPSLPLQWFTDYLSDLCEDENIQRYLDIRVFLTNIDSPPDELASALLQLGLKTAGENCSVRRPSQPQLNNLYQMTSYGVPDFDSLLDCRWHAHTPFVSIYAAIVHIRGMACVFT